MEELKCSALEEAQIGCFNELISGCASVALAIVVLVVLVSDSILSIDVDRIVVV